MNKNLKQPGFSIGWKQISVNPTLSSNGSRIYMGSFIFVRKHL